MKYQVGPNVTPKNASRQKASFRWRKKTLHDWWAHRSENLANPDGKEFAHFGEFGAVIECHFEAHLKRIYGGLNGR